MNQPRLLLLAALLAGCTAEVRESDLLRPVRGGGLTAEALAAAAPAYALTQHRILRKVGAEAIGACRAFLQRLD